MTPDDKEERMTDSPTIHVGFTADDFKRSVWSLVLTALGVFAVAALGILNDLLESCKTACDWNSAKVAGLAIAFGLASAILVGIKNLILADGSALKG